jgi:phosphatidylinositol alpha-mannosyltransferase
MRILHIDPDDMDNPVSGGGPVRTFEICRRLVRNGHEVTVLTPTFPGSTPEKEREGIRYIRVGRRIGDHGSSHHLTFFFQVASQLRHFPHDLLIEDFMPPMGPTFNPWFAREPLVASIQWFSPDAWQRQFKLPFVVGQKLLMANYDNFVVLTEQMEKQVRQARPRAAIRTIPNAVSEDYFTTVPSYGDFILYVGRVDPRDKGVDMLLDAYARIPAAARIPLVIAGHGWEFDQFRHQAVALGIEREVSFLGKTPIEETRQLFATCRFACVPSRVETFGIVIIEAQAAAKSVVLFDRWPMNEVAQRGGCEIVPAFDVDAYANAMLRLLNESVDELGQRGEVNRRFARQYDWTASARAQESFYREVLQREARGVRMREEE